MYFDSITVIQYINLFLLEDIVFTWTAFCTSCDINSSPRESYKGKMTLDKCKGLCQSDKLCTAIDYGKGSRNEECHLNYGGKKSYKSHAGFNGYILSRNAGIKYLSLFNMFIKPESIIAL